MAQPIIGAGNVQPLPVDPLVGLFAGIMNIPRFQTDVFNPQVNQLNAAVDGLATREDIRHLEDRIEAPTAWAEKPIPQRIRELQNRANYVVREQEKAVIAQAEEMRQAAVIFNAAAVVVAVAALPIAPAIAAPVASSLLNPLVYAHRCRVRPGALVKKTNFNGGEALKQFFLNLTTTVATGGLAKLWSPALAMLQNPLPAQIAIQAGLNGGNVIVQRAANHEPLRVRDVAIAVFAGGVGAAVGAGVQQLVGPQAATPVRIVHAGAVSAANAGACGIIENKSEGRKWNEDLGERLFLAAASGMINKAGQIREEIQRRDELKALKAKLKDLKEKLAQSEGDKTKIENEIKKLADKIKELKAEKQAVRQRLKKWIEQQLKDGYQLPEGMNLRQTLNFLMQNKELTLLYKRPPHCLRLLIVDNQVYVYKDRGFLTCLPINAEIFKDFKPDLDQKKRDLSDVKKVIKNQKNEVKNHRQDQRQVKGQYKVAEQAARGFYPPVYTPNRQEAPVAGVAPIRAFRIEVPARAPIVFQAIEVPAPQPEPVLPPPGPGPIDPPVPPVTPPPGPGPIDPPVPPVTPPPGPGPIDPPVPPVTPPPGPGPIDPPVPPVTPPPGPGFIAQLVQEVRHGNYNSLVQLQRLRVLSADELNDLVNSFIHSPLALNNLSIAIRANGDVEALRLVRRIHREVRELPQMRTLENARLHAKTRINRKLHAQPMAKHPGAQPAVVQPVVPVVGVQAAPAVLPVLPVAAPGGIS